MYLKRNLLTCFIDDQFDLHSTDFLNMDMVAWACDYPHSDCVWPNSPETVWESIKHLPKEFIDKTTHLNAICEFRFGPFAIPTVLAHIEWFLVKVMMRTHGIQPASRRLRLRRHARARGAIRS